MNIRGTAKKVGCTIYTFVSRRAAGVWTHLPSLTYALFDEISSPTVAIWIDFGMRYEMFNHFRIDAYQFSPDGTMLQLMARHAEGHTFSVKDIIAYEQVVRITKHKSSEKPLSEIRGGQTAEYKNIVIRRAEGGEQIYIIPWYTPRVSPNLLTSPVDLKLFEAVMTDLLENIRPQYVFLTWEGQPEARLFSPILQEDRLLSWGLRESDKIISMVRFDSEERFKDSVSIPTLIAEDQSYKDKLCLILTRAQQLPQNVPAMNHVIGSLPFAACIGPSIQAGRIPIIDAWCRKESETLDEEDIEYIKAVKHLAGKMVRNDHDY